MQLESTLTCPSCGHRSVETMPTDACVFFYAARAAGRGLSPSLATVACSAPMARSRVRRCRAMIAVACLGLLKLEARDRSPGPMKPSLTSATLSSSSIAMPGISPGIAGLASAGWYDLVSSPQQASCSSLRNRSWDSSPTTSRG
jgi:hypothetical protein